MMISVNRDFAFRGAGVSSIGVPHFQTVDNNLRCRVMLPIRLCRPVGLEATSGDDLKVRRTSSVLFVLNSNKRALSQLFEGVPYGLSSFSSLVHGRGNFRPNSQPLRSQTVSFQATTTDNDSNNSDGLGSPAQALHMSSVWPCVEDVRPLFVSSVQELQEGIRALKDRDWVERPKAILSETFNKTTISLGRLFEAVSLGKALTEGRKVFSSLDPWIKWPLLIFSIVYLAVVIPFGFEVAQDLIPLWIMGPLVTGGVIRSAYWATELSQRCFTAVKPSLKAAFVVATQICKDAQSGQLMYSIQNLAQLKTEELKEKRSQLAQYVRSGQVAADFLNFMKLSLFQLWDWGSDIYADFLEWIRPYWRAFARLMKKLF